MEYVRRFLIVPIDGVSHGYYIVHSAFCVVNRVFYSPQHVGFIKENSPLKSLSGVTDCEVV